jgi:hypothetical protein
VHNLEFLKDGAGAPTKTAIGMYSGALRPIFILTLTTKTAFGMYSGARCRN